MRAKHSLWVACANSRGAVTATDPLKREALDRWNYVAFLERFGWVTPQDYALLPADLKHDMLTICSIRDAKQKSSTPSKNGR